MNIRENIKNNFKDNNTEEIKKSIEDSIEEADEITLPGLGVFFELLWKNSDSEFQRQILKTIKQAI